MEAVALGRLLVGIGLVTAVVGGLVWLIGTLAPGVRLGRLPGDIVVEQGGTKVYFPLMTMLLASAFLTLVFWLVGALRR